MPAPRLRAVMWNGELVALAGAERFYVIAPHLSAADASLDDLAYVALLCLFHRQALTGALPSNVDPTLAERWVDAMLGSRTKPVSD